MSLGFDNLLGLRFHRVFDTGVFSQPQQKLSGKVIYVCEFQKKGMKRTFWKEVLLKLRVSSDRLVISKKVFSGSIH